MNKVIKAPQVWKEIITPGTNIWSLNVRELYEYRDLLLIWMRRDILSIYTQTVLGPVWFILQPVLTTAVYVIVFSKFAKISVGGYSPVLFYLGGVILWNYFSDCIVKTSVFFKDSNAIFSKVYFPKLIIPFSIVLTNLIKFSIQLVLFMAVYIYFFVTNNSLHPNLYILLFPLLIIFTGLLGLGAGLIVSSLTIRYKDLSHLLTFGIQLLMFVSPVFYPISNIPTGPYRKLILANPMTGIIECFRFSFTGSGYFNWQLLTYDFVIIAALLFAGIVLFNLTEKNAVDII